MKRQFLMPIIIVVLLGVLASACAPAAAPTPTPTKPPAPPTAAPTPVAVATPTPMPPTPTKPAALQKITFTTDFGFFGRHAPYYTVLDKGFWKEAGFDVTIVRGAGSLDAIKMVAAGKADFGFADSGALIITRANENVPVKELAIIYQKAPQAIYCLEESGIKKPKDLEGKVLSDSAASAVPKLFPAYAKLAGIDASKVTWKFVDPATLPALLAAKQVDGISQFMPGEPMLEKAVAPKKLVRLAYADAGMEMYSNGIIATDETIQKQPDMVRRFVLATLKGVQYALDHPDEAGAIMKKYHPEGDAAIYAAEVRIVRQLAITDDTNKYGLGYIDPKRMEKTRDLLSEPLGAKRIVAVEELYAPGFHLPKP
ncbi:MAG: ABC transporter substrate-binding protein [Chloroflexi bacterium]|nr:ABC transporter substrate-binding protein [Chloroflexota bacterium]MCL5074998.1 ABC transporter substrate-binding protein [Chloroflexota bacterium]